MNRRSDRRAAPTAANFERRSIADHELERRGRSRSRGAAGGRRRTGSCQGLLGDHGYGAGGDVGVQRVERIAEPAPVPVVVPVSERHDATLLRSIPVAVVKPRESSRRNRPGGRDDHPPYPHDVC